MWRRARMTRGSRWPMDGCVWQRRCGSRRVSRSRSRTRISSAARPDLCCGHHGGAFARCPHPARTRKRPINDKSILRGGTIEPRGARRLFKVRPLRSPRASLGGASRRRMAVFGQAFRRSANRARTPAQRSHFGGEISRYFHACADFQNDGSSQAHQGSPLECGSNRAHPATQGRVAASAPGVTPSLV